MRFLANWSSHARPILIAPICGILVILSLVGMRSAGAQDADGIRAVAYAHSLHKLGKADDVERRLKL